MDNPFKRAAREMTKVQRKRMDRVAPKPRLNPHKQALRQGMAAAKSELSRQLLDRRREVERATRAMDLMEDRVREQTHMDRYGVIVGPHSRKYPHGKGI